ncbi:hypothetical protein [Epilithonimonas sp.]|uniref:hypothetical protein n=1 Tax=Epilithonimonas sp. TaxID=2894511 RepID=UPI00289A5E0E|nr:hypothetical protein [Epilithonimonas sp.]
MNILHEKSNLTRLAQSHKGFEPFNYDFSVDWAIELLEKGIATENIQILASFPKPTDAWEIKSYVHKVLKEFDLEEFEDEEAIQNMCYYYILSIINEEGNLKSHLEKLSYFCIKSDYESSIFPFYLLKFSWEDLQDLGTSYHYDGVTLQNFNTVVRKEAKIWMENFEKKSQ